MVGRKMKQVPFLSETTPPVNQNTRRQIHNIVMYLDIAVDTLNVKYRVWFVKLQR